MAQARNAFRSARPGVLVTRCVNKDVTRASSFDVDPGELGAKGGKGPSFLYSPAPILKPVLVCTKLT
jgi:hypothetical protein